MSSAAKPTGSGGADRHTYWCHECDMSVSLSPLSHSPLACPHCFGDFLELMDSPLFPSPSPASSADNDTFLLNGPFLRRLIHHLSSTSSGDPNSADPSASLPASKTSVDALPTLAISSAQLELDPFLLCAICKDHFAPADVARELPCRHLYHPGCILPWLAHHNSCPVCRFRLPAEETERESAEAMVLMAGDGEDWFDYASTLRHIARRHNLAGQLAEEVVEEEAAGTDGLGGMGDGESASEN